MARTEWLSFHLIRFLWQPVLEAITLISRSGGGKAAGVGGVGSGEWFINALWMCCIKHGDWLTCTALEARTLRREDARVSPSPCCFSSSSLSSFFPAAQQFSFFSFFHSGPFFVLRKAASKINGICRNEIKVSGGGGGGGWWWLCGCGRSCWVGEGRGELGIECGITAFQANKEDMPRKTRRLNFAVC